ncbi:NADPH:quinone oxidoreductase family protein [Novosphingobium cyanobacteriorum]|uniref:NADPH:quinone oxidoreductase family protein n=1 Tax=Novosphingobium cyanobacteriorum TaxID=3024215 RepID=A0ABT6CEG1_9SPHN|nr:NADPH:quinone oxidoreductase family protein [Novosphingobium cyanobacteriorum]MDF8332191.1 NADPH:quinone oxidoreductase family protein [Novosphingobium cyanobacteriorum]
MQAVEIRALADDLAGVRLADVPAPRPAADQLLVQVRATSLNFPDLLMTRGAYQFKPALPFVPGMEVAGLVAEAPEGSPFRVGDRVFGGMRFGGMAEYACLDIAAAQVIPASMDFATAAAFGAAYGTAWTALVEIGGLLQDQWVLIHGASGGVGMAAADVAQALGARVILTSGSKEKMSALEATGWARAVLPADGRFRDQVAELTNGQLADLVFDPVGGDVFDESTRCVAFGGKLLVIGFAAGRIPTVATNIPLIKGFSLVGVRAGEYARRFPERGRAVRESLLGLAEQGRFSPRVDRVLPLSRWREAFTAMGNREIIGKIVLQP